jgi:8-oxo-dGTP pyrophosphatase MutT (NUDIX family)
MVRPAQNKPISEVVSDYEVLFCKRHDKTAFGGFYAFPGGRIDDSDSFEHWMDNYPSFTSQHDQYFDFNKRISVIRETFEEVNVCLTDKNQESDLDRYLNHYRSDFTKYCEGEKVQPQMNKLKAFTRLASPINKYPVFDA